jgi:hypothetical protein
VVITLPNIGVRSIGTKSVQWNRLTFIQLETKKIGGLIYTRSRWYRAKNITKIFMKNCIVEFIQCISHLC